MSVQSRRSQPLLSLLGSATTPLGKYPQEIAPDVSPMQTFYDCAEVLPRCPSKYTPDTPDMLRDYRFFELPETPPIRTTNSGCQIFAHVPNHSPTPRKLLRPRTRVWAASACRKRTSIKRHNYATRSATRKAFQDDGIESEADDETTRLGSLSSLIRRRSHPRPPEPPFKVIVPTSQALTKSLSLDDCPEVLAASPYYGLYLLCKRLSLSGFDSNTVPNPEIEVPYSVVHHIEHKLCQEDSNNFEKWMPLASTNRYKKALSKRPIIDMLEMLDSARVTEDGVLLVSKIALEDLAIRLVLCWPQSTPQDEAFQV